MSIAAGKGGKHGVKSMLSHMISDGSVSQEEKAEKVGQKISKVSLFRKKAMDTKRIRDSFKFWEAITALVDFCGGPKHVAKRSWQKSNASTWSAIVSGVFSFILMMAYHRQQEKGANWSYIFFRYMANGEAKVNNILTPKKVKSYYDLMHRILDQVPSEMKLQAEEISQFFEHHVYDPYSTVVGQLVSKEVLSEAAEITDPMIPGLCGTDPFTFLLMQESKKKRSDRVKYQELVKMVTVWSSITSSEERRRELKNFVSVLRGVHEIPLGNLVIAKVALEGQETPEWRYARIAGKPVGKLALVYTNPLESIMVSVPFDKVLPIDESVLSNFFSTEAPDKMERCVELQGDRELYKIMNHCKERAAQYLTDTGVDFEVVQLGKKALCSLVHLSTLYEIAETLKKDIPKAVFEEVESYASTELQACVDRMEAGNDWELFQPTKDVRREQLMEFEVQAALKSEYRQYVGACNMAIEEMESYKLRIMNGQRKSELGIWWLDLIGKRVKDYLMKSGFVHNAIGANYLDEPPRDTAIVRKNLILLKRILKSVQSSNDHFKLKVFIKDICNTVYPKIISFMGDLRICLLLVIGMTDKDKFDAKVVKTAVSEMPKGESKKAAKAMLKDLKYLAEMQRIEEKAEKGEPRMDVIPISGLVISKLCRLENEARTVLDLWEPVVFTRQDEDTRTPLENAIIKRDLKTVDSMVKNGLCDLNETDTNGWTSLHLACSFCFNTSRLDVVNQLLGYNELDVMAKNNFGNLAIHYLSRMPLKEEEKRAFEQAMSTLLSKKPMALYCQNSSGETPLHTAALAANLTSMTMLLANGADPNAQTATGESALHYAVKSQSAQGTELVLSYGADKNMKDETDSSPLELAVKLNLENVIKVLQNKSPNYDARTLAAQNKQKREEFISSQSAQQLRSLWQRPVVDPELQSVIQEFGDEAVAPQNVNWNKAAVPDSILLAIQEKEINEAAMPAACPRSKLSDDYIVQALPASSLAVEGGKTWSKQNVPEDIQRAMEEAGHMSPRLSHSTSTAQITTPPDSPGKLSSSSSRASVRKSSTLRSLKGLKAQVKAPLVPRKGKKAPKALPPVVVPQRSLLDVDPVSHKQSIGPQIGSLGVSVSDMAKLRKERMSRQAVEAAPEQATPEQESTPAAVDNKRERPFITQFEDGKIYCKALFDHEPEEEDELLFFVGEIFEVLDNDDAEGWWDGLIGDTSGSFPYNYVELFTPPPAIKAKPPIPARPTVTRDAQAPSSEPEPASTLEPAAARAPEPKAKAEHVSEQKPMVNIPLTSARGAVQMPKSRSRTEPPAVAKKAADAKPLPTPPVGKPLPKLPPGAPIAASITSPVVSPVVSPVASPAVSPSVERKAGLENAVVACTFEAQADEEMSVEAGTRLQVLRKENDGWWLVKKDDGTEGIVPGSFLTLVNQDGLPLRGQPIAKGARGGRGRGRPLSMAIRGGRGGRGRGRARPKSAIMSPMNRRGRGRGLPQPPTN